MPCLPSRPWVDKLKYKDDFFLQSVIILFYMKLYLANLLSYMVKINLQTYNHYNVFAKLKTRIILSKRGKAGWHNEYNEGLIMVLNHILLHNQWQPPPFPYFDKNWKSVLFLFLASTGEISPFGTVSYPSFNHVGNF